MKPLRRALQNGPSPMAIRHSCRKFFTAPTQRERSIGQSLKFCTVVNFGGKMCNVILKSLLTLYFQFHIEK